MAENNINRNQLFVNSNQNAFLNGKHAPNKFGLNIVATNPINDSYKFQSSTGTNTEKKAKFDLKDVRQKLSNFIQFNKFKSYANTQEIEYMLSANPEIQESLQSVGLTPTICLDNLYSMYDSHFSDTVNIAKKIGQNMGLSQAEMKIVEKGALFHDFGKVLIPRELLEKPSELSAEERKIVSKHAVLGYELLKTTGMEPEVLEIIKNHHKYRYNIKDERIAKLSQIVTVADIYSALTTERVYKKAMSDEQAMKILNKLSDEGKLDKTVVKALEKELYKEYGEEKIAA